MHRVKQIRPLTGRTLALGALGGALASLLSLPLAWMLGALFMILAVSLLGMATAVDKRLHRLAIATLGVFIGQRVDVGELVQLVAWYPSVIAMLLYMALLLVGGGALFMRGGVAPLNALFSAFPGSMNSALVLAERAGGDVRWIAISHSMRLAVVVSSAALMASLLVDEVAMADDTGLLTVDLFWWLLAPVSWWLGRCLRLPLAEFLGPLLASALLTSLGVPLALPGVCLLATFLILGSSIGSRFSATSWRRVVQVGRVGLLFALFAVVLAVGVALLVAFTTELSFVAVLLALLPGGVGEMAVIAVAVDVDPVYVVSHHVLRLLLLIVLTPWMLRWVRSRYGASMPGS
nr:AbrB family transcriptional regulator [Halomonas socia]